MAKSKQIAIASDHGAFDMKSKIISRLKSMGYEPIDMGTDGPDSVDYPDYAQAVATAISSGEIERGILLCGTGIGMSITANKFAGVRAALAYDGYTAKMSREHNDSNILVLGGRTTGVRVAYDILETWLETPFEGGRHQGRLDKISLIEKNYSGEKTNVD